MKNLFLALLCVTFINGFSQTKKVKVKIAQIVAYCGGIKPTAEMEAQQKIPVPYSCRKLICVSDKNKIDTVTTDKNGFLITKRALGTYSFFEPWKFYKKLPNGEQESNMKMDCLAEEWAKPDLKITVAKTITVVNNLEYKPCPYRFPCLINRHYPN